MKTLHFKKWKIAKLISVALYVLVFSVSTNTFAQKVQAPVAKSVEIAAVGSSNSIGYFEKEASGTWKSTINGQTLAYTETSKDQWSVGLKNKTTGEVLILNLWTEKVLTNSGQKYSILKSSESAMSNGASGTTATTSSSMPANSSKVQAPVAKTVEVAPVGSTKSIGFFVKEGAGTWKSLINGQSNSYTETSQDQWSIGLKDKSTNEVLILNLWTQKVLTNSGQKYAVRNSSSEQMTLPSSSNSSSSSSSTSNSGTASSSSSSSQSSGSSTSTTTTGATWNFYNDGRFPLELSINGKSIGTLEVSQRAQPMPVKLGDEVTVKVLGNNPENLGYPTILFNGSSANPMTIIPRRAFSIGSGDVLGYNYAVNLHGFDLTQFNPVNIQESISTRGQIFDGLHDQSYEYSQLGGTGPYMPKGFYNKGDTNVGGGNYGKTTIIGRSKMKEAWAIGATAEVPIPVEPTGQSTVTPTVGFNYGESKIENASESDVFITKSERKGLYSLELISLNDVILTKSFVRDVERIATLNDAKAVVDKYGTHYTDHVYYGGQYHSVIRIHEDTYYQANTSNLDLTVGLSVDQSGETLGQGELKISHEKEQSNEDIFGNIKSEYWYTGGTGNGDSWTADRNNSVAIKIGNLYYISDLVKPNIFKTLLDEQDLKPKRDLIKQAIVNKLSGMKYIEKPKAYRALHYRVESIKYLSHIDDANTNTKGEITAQIIDNGVPQAKQTLWQSKEWAQNNIGGLLDRQGFHLTRDKSNRNSRWQKIRQEGEYVGSKSDTNIKFKPLQIKFDGTILDFDDINTYEQMYIVGAPVMNIGSSSKRQFYDFVISSKNGSIKVKVTIEVVPLIGF